MVVDRKTVVENFGRHVLGFTEAEDRAYPDLVELIAVLQSIRRGVIMFSDSPGDYAEDRVNEFLIHHEEYSRKKRKRRLMEPNKCHDNAITLAESDSTLRVIRGWAFRTGGWFGHSWGWDPRDERVIETTSLNWILYWGRDITEQIKGRS